MWWEVLLPLLSSLAPRKAKEHGWVSLSLGALYQQDLTAHCGCRLPLSQYPLWECTDLLMGTVELGCRCSPWQGKAKPRISQPFSFSWQ